MAIVAVYTELRQRDSPFIETSNMFLLRDEEDASGVDVWIFGTGYGDAAGLAYFPHHISRSRSAAW